MITTEKLKTLREALTISLTQLDELLRVRQKEKLFDNADDYYVQLRSCEYVPQDFYRLRIFDTEIFLKFNQRIKKYYINIETLKYEFFRKTSFNEFMSKYKIKTDTFEKNWFIPQTYKFDEIIKIFSEFCIMFLSLYTSETELFYYK